MSVRKLKENKITKDGRAWVFMQYSKGLKQEDYNVNIYTLKINFYCFSTSIKSL